MRWSSDGGLHGVAVSANAVVDSKTPGEGFNKSYRMNSWNWRGIDDLKNKFVRFKGLNQF